MYRSGPAARAQASLVPNRRSRPNCRNPQARETTPATIAADWRYQIGLLPEPLIMIACELDVSIEELRCQLSAALTVPP